MTRLQAELYRLYHPHPSTEHNGISPLLTPQGLVRAMVMSVAHPASWETLSVVWRGVQAELDLPAPGIAVSGTDAFQLWFSVAEPLPAAQAHAFLELLRLRFLHDVPARRLGLLPATGVSFPGGAVHAPQVPSEQPDTGHWSAFLAPDLAPVFDGTPWLDIPPSEEGQADLLRRLESIKPAAFASALARLRRPGPQARPALSLPGELAIESAALPFGASPALAAADPAAGLDPRQFLLQVMNDSTVPLALRIEAAKALLPIVVDGPPATAD